MRSCVYFALILLDPFLFLFLLIILKYYFIKCNSKKEEKKINWRMTTCCSIQRSTSIHAHKYNLARELFAFLLRSLFSVTKYIYSYIFAIKIEKHFAVSFIMLCFKMTTTTTIIPIFTHLLLLLFFSSIGPWQSN